MAKHRVPPTNRTRTIVAGVCAAALATVVGVGAQTASAAPITCPGGQVATQTSPGTWDCVNNGGNASNAENPKNPNVGKGFF